AAAAPGVAAVAVVAGGGRGGGDGGGGHLVVAADAYQRLSVAGRRVVLRHELTHLATAAVTPPAMPVWLVEGLADTVGHRATLDRPDPARPDALTVRQAAAELAAEVSAGELPAEPPPDAAFDPTDGRLAATYQQAWLACRYLASRLGLDGLVDYYREVAAALARPAVDPTPGSAAQPPAQQVAQRVLADAGLAWLDFVRGWQAYLRELLAGPGEPAGPDPGAGW
ncbi:MAG: hypothetical protein IRZ08_19410, partial [Frankia sp.]|nr:hypothetical protein [Frankia sp.]